jgi:hypothetical protein
MKRLWYLPLVLQALVGPSSEPCQGLEGDARVRCEAAVRDDRSPVSPLPPARRLKAPANQQDQVTPPFRTGQEFDSNRTFSGQEQGSPGF